MMTIRLAQEEDRDFLRAAFAQLDEEMQALYREMTGEELTAPERSEETLMQLISGDPAITLVAEDGEPMGFAVVVRRDRTRLHLDDLEVLPAFRGRGVGTALVEEVKLMTREAECTELTLQAFTGNAAALKLYERLGFRPTRVLLRAKV